MADITEIAAQFPNRECFRERPTIEKAYTMDVLHQVIVNLTSDDRMQLALELGIATMPFGAHPEEILGAYFGIDKTEVNRLRRNVW